MNIGSWYIQRFSDETLYFLPVAEQKGRGYSGILVRVDETRPRARPRATKSSAPSGPYGSAAHWSVLWKSVSQAPANVERALADRFPEIALAKGVITSRDRGRRARDNGRRTRVKYMTKPGRHGTLTLFRITYTDPRDEGFGRDAWRTWAYDREHAIDNFYDSEDGDEGWKILDVEKVRDRS